VNSTEIYRRIAVKYFDNIMILRKVHQWAEIFKGYRRTLLKLLFLSCRRLKRVEAHPRKQKNRAYMKSRSKCALKELNVTRPKTKYYFPLNQKT
jgi:hypothetical protein